MGTKLEELDLYAVKDTSTGDVTIKCRRPTRRGSLLLSSAVDPDELIDFDDSNITDLKEDIEAFMQQSTS